MMHVEPMEESAGVLSEPVSTNRPCRNCGEREVLEQTWDSHCGGYTDWKFTCIACAYVWWVEGIDS